MIELKITADNVQQLKTSLGELLQSKMLDRASDAQMELPLEEKRKPGRKKKETDDALPSARSSEETGTVTEADPARPLELTASDITQVFTRLVDKKGMTQAKAILDQFKVKRISELKPEQYAAVNDACDTILAS